MRFYRFVLHFPRSPILRITALTYGFLYNTRFFFCFSAVLHYTIFSLVLQTVAKKQEYSLATQSVVELQILAPPMVPFTNAILF